MNITLYPVQDFTESNVFTPFDIELDGLTEEQYQQKAAVGLFKHSKTGSTVSSRCQKCGHVTIGVIPSVCLECGSIRFTHKKTNATYAMCDVQGIPESYIKNEQLTPLFWEHTDLISENLTGVIPELGIGLYGDAPLEAVLMDGVYCAEYLTDAEVAEEYADVFDDTFPDANQDWPLEQQVEGFSYFDFAPGHLNNEGFNF